MIEGYSISEYSILAAAGEDPDALVSSRWTAPELLNMDENPERTTQSDVFAFGMKIVEV